MPASPTILASTGQIRSSQSTDPRQVSNGEANGGDVAGFFGRVPQVLSGLSDIVPDEHRSFPTAAIARLHEAGVLAATLPEEFGGLDFCDPARAELLKRILVQVGRCNQVLGRLYEGHVNAHALVFRYGDPQARAQVAADTKAGRVFGVWNAESADAGLKLDSGARTLRGGKIYASGAGYIERPLITADMQDGRVQMLIARLEGGERAETGGWRARGMRASATETISFEGYPLDRAIVVGEPDTYQRQPFFSAGAWRFLAVHLGGIEAVHLGHKAHLVRLKRHEDPHQLARLGQSAIAVETARAFVDRACLLANDEAANDAGSIVAYVNLARAAVERAGLDVIELAQRSVGLSSMFEDHPLERLTRDLSVYLRQPGPDYALTSAARQLCETQHCYLCADEVAPA